ncbi:MAG: pyruvate formate lyase-activating protein [Firmicutes bacterium]|nr:pyruvate formate lyase-activating protein [Bacillota bacterium]
MIGYIDSVETMGLVDGPGIRFVVFFKGCKLRCLFCHNPETWTKDNALEITSEELLKKILKYKNYYVDGGVTFSGGEPLLQDEFLIDILKKCKMVNLHTAIDTSGVGIGNYEEILKYTDLVILDIKAIDNEGFNYMTGQNIDEFYKFLDICQRLNKKLWLRQVIVPGINDTEKYILKLKEFISKIKNVEKIELLPYHLYGVDKYQKLGIEYKLKGVSAMDETHLKELYNLLIQKD